MALSIDPKRTAILALDLQNDIVTATPGVAEKKILPTIGQSALSDGSEEDENAGS
jgi:hypothetical protein